MKAPKYTFIAGLGSAHT